MTFDYHVWYDLGQSMANGNYKGRYFTPEIYQAKNPLENLVVIPGTTDFFGTKVCNIFIVGIPYGYNYISGAGWVNQWPPDGFEDAVNRHIATYQYYTKYETHVYMDYNLVALIMDDQPTSNFRAMMDLTKLNMQQMCFRLASYGFVMEDDITGEVGADFFAPVINKFYGLTP